MFATVGTTKFTALMETLDKEEVQAALAAKGFKRLLVQTGSWPFPSLCPLSSFFFPPFFSFPLTISLPSSGSCQRGGERGEEMQKEVGTRVALTLTLTPNPTLTGGGRRQKEYCGTKAASGNRGLNVPLQAVRLPLTHSFSNNHKHSVAHKHAHARTRAYRHT